MFQFLKEKLSNNKTEISWSARLKNSLKSTRNQLSASIMNLFSNKSTIDSTLFNELESILLSADVGIQATDAILEQLKNQTKKKALRDTHQCFQALRKILIDILTSSEQLLKLDQSPLILLMVGINGAGKTTSAAKLAHYYQQKNKKVILAAGDTFRAAATEQLQAWGQKNDITVIAQQRGADSASVIYNTIQVAQAKNTDLVIADTAGRLHTQVHLMAELQKIKRVITKFNRTFACETMLTIDASTGQNALRQVEQFHQAIQLTGITITKLDGTAKGGIVFPMAEKIKLPIRFIGIGEGINDLRPFNAEDYINALFEKSAPLKTQ